MDKITIPELPEIDLITELCDERTIDQIAQRLNRHWHKLSSNLPDTVIVGQYDDAAYQDAYMRGQHIGQMRMLRAVLSVISSAPSRSYAM